MRQSFKTVLQPVLTDRWMGGLLVANAVIAALVVVLLGVSIEPKETQVVTQYSAFGVTGFYRDYWYMLWAYALLELVVLFGHGALSVKLHRLERRGLALALLWLTLGVSALVYLFARSIIKVAALG